MNRYHCEHNNLIKTKNITTGECTPSGKKYGCGCTGYCKEPIGLQEYICTDCGKNIYKEQETINCRSQEGEAIGLIDSIIYISREVARKNLNHLEVKEALKDLYADESFQFILSQCQSVVENDL